MPSYCDSSDCGELAKTFCSECQKYFCKRHDGEHRVKVKAHYQALRLVGEGNAPLPTKEEEYLCSSPDCGAPATLICDRCLGGAGRLFCDEHYNHTEKRRATHGEPRRLAASDGLSDPMQRLGAVDDDDRRNRKSAGKDDGENDAGDDDAYLVNSRGRSKDSTQVARRRKDHRAGHVIYCRHGKRGLEVLLAVETCKGGNGAYGLHYNLVGGKRDFACESPSRTAAREVCEETMGILGSEREVEATLVSPRVHAVWMEGAKSMVFVVPPPPHESDEAKILASLPQEYARRIRFGRPFEAEAYNFDWILWSDALKSSVVYPPKHVKSAPGSRRGSVLQHRPSQFVVKATKCAELTDALDRVIRGVRPVNTGPTEDDARDDSREPDAPAQPSSHRRDFRSPYRMDLHELKKNIREEIEFANMLLRLRDDGDILNQVKPEWEMTITAPPPPPPPAIRVLNPNDSEYKAAVAQVPADVMGNLVSVREVKVQSRMAAYKAAIARKGQKFQKELYTYHGTPDRWRATAIAFSGFNLSITTHGRALGNGVYSATDVSIPLRYSRGTGSIIKLRAAVTSDPKTVINGTVHVFPDPSLVLPVNIYDFVASDSEDANQMRDEIDEAERRRIKEYRRIQEKVQSSAEEFGAEVGKRMRRAVEEYRRLLEELQSDMDEVGEMVRGVERESLLASIDSAFELLRGEFERFLPIFLDRADLMKAMKENAVIVVSASTGSGKSTQLPQYLLRVLEEEGRIGAECVASAEEDPLGGHGEDEDGEDGDSDIDGGAEGGMPIRKRIAVLQPRRVNATGIASRVAEERGGRLGVEVGYSIGGGRTECCADTTIEFMTHGFFAQKCLEGRIEDKYVGVIVDEAHERSVEIDLTLLLLRRALERADVGSLRVIVCSATIEGMADKFAQHLMPDSSRRTVIELHGRTFPVVTTYADELGSIFDAGGDGGDSGDGGNSGARHRPDTDKDDDDNRTDAGARRVSPPGTREFSTAMRDYLAARTIEVFKSSRETGGNIIAFLPGKAEIDEAVSATIEVLSQLFNTEMRSNEITIKLKSKSKGKVKVKDIRVGVYPFHSQLTEQQKIRVTDPTVDRMIVFATNAAETGLTIDNVRFVIDTGLERHTAWNSDALLQEMSTVPVSLSSANQRAGRAGRTGAGIAIRLYKESDLERMDPVPRLGIERTDLLGTVLRLCKIAANSGDRESIHTIRRELMDPIDDEQFKSILGALETLRAVEVGGDGGDDSSDADPPVAITREGRSLLAVGTEVRLAKFVLNCKALGCLGAGLHIAACISSRADRSILSALAARGGKDAEESLGDSKAQPYGIVYNVTKAVRRAKREVEQYWQKYSRGHSRDIESLMLDELVDDSSDFITLNNVMRSYLKSRDREGWCRARGVDQYDLGSCAEAHTFLMERLRADDPHVDLADNVKAIEENGGLRTVLSVALCGAFFDRFATLRSPGNPGNHTFLVFDKERRCKMQRALTCHRNRTGAKRSDVLAEDMVNAHTSGRDFSPAQVRMPSDADPAAGGLGEGGDESLIVARIAHLSVLHKRAGGSGTGGNSSASEDDADDDDQSLSDADLTDSGCGGSNDDEVDSDDGDAARPAAVGGLGALSADSHMMAIPLWNLTGDKTYHHVTFGYPLRDADLGELMRRFMGRLFRLDIYEEVVGTEDKHMELYEDAGDWRDDAPYLFHPVIATPLDGGVPLRLHITIDAPKGKAVFNKELTEAWFHAHKGPGSEIVKTIKHAVVVPISMSDCTPVPFSMDLDGTLIRQTESGEKMFNMADNLRNVAAHRSPYMEPTLLGRTVKHCFDRVRITTSRQDPDKFTGASAGQIVTAVSKLLRIDASRIDISWGRQPTSANRAAFMAECKVKRVQDARKLWHIDDARDVTRALKRAGELSLLYNTARDTAMVVWARGSSSSRSDGEYFEPNASDLDVKGDTDHGEAPMLVFGKVIVTDAGDPMISLCHFVSREEANMGLTEFCGKSSGGKSTMRVPRAPEIMHKKYHLDGDVVQSLIATRALGPLRRRYPEATMDLDKKTCMLVVRAPHGTMPLILRKVEVVLDQCKTIGVVMDVDESTNLGKFVGQGGENIKELSDRASTFLSRAINAEARPRHFTGIHCKDGKINFKLRGAACTFDQVIIAMVHNELLRINPQTANFDFEATGSGVDDDGTGGGGSKNAALHRLLTKKFTPKDNSEIEAKMEVAHFLMHVCGAKIYGGFLRDYVLRGQTPNDIDSQFDDEAHMEQAKDQLKTQYGHVQMMRDVSGKPHVQRLLDLCINVRGHVVKADLVVPVDPKSIVDADVANFALRASNTEIEEKNPGQLAKYGLSMANAKNNAKRGEYVYFIDINKSDYHFQRVVDKYAHRGWKCIKFSTPIHDDTRKKLLDKYKVESHLLPQ